MANCRFCGFEITWDKNSSDRWVPVDPSGGSHFMTCMRKDLLEKYQRERRNSADRGYSDQTDRARRILEAEQSYYEREAALPPSRRKSAHIIKFPKRRRVGGDRAL